VHLIASVYVGVSEYVEQSSKLNVNLPASALQIVWTKVIHYFIFEE
jgi:hypothetical protein